MATVFISYSHKDEEWKDRVMTHLGILENENILKLWNDRDIGIGADWFPGIEKELNNACLVIMLITANFLTSQFILRNEVPQILQRRKNEGILVVPVIVKPCAWQAVQWLSAMQLFPKDGIPVSTLEESEIDTQLANLALKIQKTVVETMVCRDVARNVSTKQPFIPPPIHLSGNPISLYKLPVTGDRLFGREKELQLLDDAWSEPQTDILTLVAWGGVGKTALVNQWLNQMKIANYRGAQKVFGWSFYSQGAEEGKQASADEFFQETLQWFGAANPEAGSAVDKGRRLARLARQQKTLLILDGLEPLQYPPGEITGLEGKLKDAGLAAFLKELAGGSAGNKVLCVITTREPVTDLLNRKGYGVTEIPLDHLSEAAGVELLNNLGATIGSKKDFHEAVTEYGGHALALTLLGQYIASILGGDIRRRDEIIKSSKGKIKEGHHAQKVMEAYMHWLGNSPERDILYIIGLFDRPVEAGAIEALKKKPAIPGVAVPFGLF
ncbi:MAG: toll/interleukin-1 receptor domain-containing protein [Candidatus Aminicenantes bacterium]|nr:toll/interleukin-1 receptor domain-containing protein [Candidatus Aminicenantes bacterium]